MYFYAHKHRQVIYRHTCHCYCSLLHIMVREKSFESESAWRQREKEEIKTASGVQQAMTSPCTCCAPEGCCLLAYRPSRGVQWPKLEAACFCTSLQEFPPWSNLFNSCGFYWHYTLTLVVVKLVVVNCVATWSKHDLSLSSHSLSLWFVLSFSLLLSRSCYIDFDSGRLLRRAPHSTSSSHFI